MPLIEREGTSHRGPFVHSFNQFALRASCVSGSILGARDQQLLKQGRLLWLGILVL